MRSGGEDEHASLLRAGLDFREVTYEVAANAGKCQAQALLPGSFKLASKNQKKILEPLRKAQAFTQRQGARRPSI